jgi:hypothetical protein
MRHEERLLFLGMITIADDEGRLLATPSRLLGAIFPHGAQTVTAEQVKVWRDEIVHKNPNVQLYAEGGIEYIAFVRWRRYQKPSHATESRLPAPPPFRPPT